MSAWQAHPPAQTAKSAKVVVYGAVGLELGQYDLDVETGRLTKKGAVTLAANVQEGWAHPAKPVLYVTWSDRPSGRGQKGGSRHGLTAFAIDRASGALLPLNEVALPGRSIHMTTDIPGEHVLVAYNEPAAVSVHKIQEDGSIGSEVKPASRLELGIYPHHVRVDPSNRTVLVVSRGNNPTSTTPEEPGSINVFTFERGVLRNRGSVAPGGGFGFQARHVDFHPTRPWVFLTLERQNKLQVFRRNADGMLSAAPLFSKETLTSPGRPGQATASIHVHPNGRFVYVSNRSGASTEFEGRQVSAGGENSIAAYEINQETGEPTRLQNADTRGFSPRTFAIDPSGRLLVVGNQSATAARDGNAVRMVPASLAVFRIQDDGRLQYLDKYDVDADANRLLWWMAVVRLS